MTEKLFITWEQFHKDSQELSIKISESGKRFKGILAITRGGLIPACIVASELNIKLIESICISSYESKAQKELTTIKPASAELVADGSDWILIDDLVDSGDTVKKIKETMPNITVATVYAKPKGKPMADLYNKDVAQAMWIVFPWEIEE